MRLVRRGWCSTTRPRSARLIWEHQLFVLWTDQCGTMPPSAANFVLLPILSTTSTSNPAEYALKTKFGMKTPELATTNPTIVQWFVLQDSTTILSSSTANMITALLFSHPTTLLPTKLLKMPLALQDFVLLRLLTGIQLTTSVQNALWGLHSSMRQLKNVSPAQSTLLGTTSPRFVWDRLIIVLPISFGIQAVSNAIPLLPVDPTRYSIR